MRFIDRPFGVAAAVFLLGSLVGAFLVLVLPPIRGPIMGLLQGRLIAPIRTVSQFGNGAILLLVFVNNSIPASLSFAYPFIIAKTHWTPPLTPEKRRALLSYYTWLCAFFLGFFGLGVALSISWLIGGKPFLFALLKGALIHGPIELTAVVLCVSEPLRLAGRGRGDLFVHLRQDLGLLLICLSALLGAAAIEVFAGI